MSTLTKGALRRVRSWPSAGVQSLRGMRDDYRRRAILQHPVGFTLPRERSVVVPDKTPTGEDTTIAARLLTAYQAGADARSSGRTDLWSGIAEHQQHFAAVLARADPTELAEYLCNVSRHDASIGITQGVHEYERISRDASYRAFLAVMAKDKLVSLAEAVGAVAIENPEQGVYGTNLSLDAGSLVDRISERVGIDVEPPDVDGGLLKLDTGRGLFGERDANAIYTAWLLKHVLAASDTPRICEIGGGSGRVAYWSHRLGLTSYTIIDLPVVNVVQGYYALKCLPANLVLLYGESHPADDARHLKIFPNHVIAEAHTPPNDVVLNQDSFPEIHRDTVVDYLGWMRRSRVRQFVSINHESRPPRGNGQLHLSVPETIREIGGFELAQRWPYWLRKGYAVELYDVITADPTITVAAKPIGLP